MIYMYPIKPYNDAKAFADTCELIQRKFPKAVHEGLITDVDGTDLDSFKMGAYSITVLNDIEVGAVYVESNMHLDELFGSGIPIGER